MILLPDFHHNLRHSGLLPHLTDQPVIVAVSGGADSLCLLHLLRQCAADLNMTLVVATLDHSLRGDAGAADASFVASLARQWALPVRQARRDVGALVQTHRFSVEEAARRVRYSFLAETAREVNAHTILTGHHADDQAETILLHLIRGSGMAGLQGMRAVTPLGASHVLPTERPATDRVIVRPLLPFSRQAIEDYCQQHGLEPREDATNAEVSYTRNRIRHEVLPLLEQLNPGIRQALAQTGAIIESDYTKLSRLADAALARATIETSSGTLHLDVAAFQAADISLQRGMLRAAVHQLSTPTTEIGFVTLEAARNLAMHGTTGQQATLPDGITLHIAYNTLILQRPDAPSSRPNWPLLPSGTSLTVNVPGITPMPEGRWRLVTRWLSDGEDPAEFHNRPFTATLDIPQNAMLHLRNRQPGDRFMPLGMAGKSQKLKETLINARIPAALRDELPILTVNHEIAWIIAGNASRVAEPFAIRKESQKKLLLYCVCD